MGGHNRIGGLFQHIINRLLGSMRHIHQNTEAVQFIHDFTTERSEPSRHPLFRVTIDPVLRHTMDKPRHAETDLVISSKHREVICHQQIFRVQKNRNLFGSPRIPSLPRGGHKLQLRTSST